MTGSFISVRVSGGLLPSDVLSAVLAGNLEGLRSTDYHLAGENPREASARVWTHLLGVYRRFRDDLARLPEGDAAVGLTRERWLTVVLSELGYGRVPVTGTGGLAAGDKQYPVSHLWGSTPIHLLGWGVPLDKRTPGVPGAAQRAPHAMVQELLNRTDDYLWAIVSNGRVLRLLRDSTTLTGQAYVEFDLEAMFDGELFAEFALLYLLAHQSRVEVPAEGVLADCWLERWRTSAISQGVRALNLLRDGVQDALETLGTGFLQHPANARLREDLASGAIRLEDLHAGLLRTVYRLLFWSVAEDRDALHTPDAPRDVRDRYAQHFSSGRLRRLAVRRQGSAHDDLWQSVDLVLTALGRQNGEPRLGLPGLGGLFTTTHADVLAGARLGNQPLLKVIRSLSVVQPKGPPRRLVDFRHLGAEELGSIYESLLELVPRHDPTRQVFTLENLAGNDRKTTGSYYTPSDLVDLVLDTALDPVLDDAEKQPNREQALLAVTVCDPAIGSGHFMVAAARRIANRLAMVRTEEVDPSPADLQQAMHDVVARCIYGVDLNPMAADLAKVSLWLEAMTPGQPLSFLDHHIKVGNALLGTTPALLHAGIPDSAYAPLGDDDKKTVTAWKNHNKKLRDGQLQLLSEAGIPVGNEGLRIASEEIAERATTGHTLADMAWAAQRYTAGQSSEAAVRARRTADAWCAAFLGRKTTNDEPITHATLEALSGGAAPQHAIDSVDSLAVQYRLFHWHLEFPEIFSVPGDNPANTPTGWTGGFSAVLGNPPWERIKLQEQEFFASRDVSIAEAKNAAARKKAIRALALSQPGLLAEFTLARRRSEAESHFLRSSGRYPLCGTGDVNTYSVFAEHFRSAVAPYGRAGIITPTGLATAETTAAFFSDTLKSERLVAFYDFANHKRGIFAGLKGQSWFAVTVLTGGEQVRDARVAFDLAGPDEAATQRFTLANEEIRLVNPNTGTLPVFRTRRDAEITLACYRRHPALIRDGVSVGNPWNIRLRTLFHMANDSSAFLAAADLESLGAEFDGWSWSIGDRRWLPLYEGKMLHIYQHRFGTYSGYDLKDGTGVRAIPTPTDRQLDDPNLEPLARYWVAEAAVDKSTPESKEQGWLVGIRRLTNISNARTFVPVYLPRAAVGDNAWIVSGLSQKAHCFLGVTSSLIVDFLVRQKLSGSTLSGYIIEQIAIPKPEAFDTHPQWAETSLDEFISSRVLELTYTSWHIEPFASSISVHTGGAPFRWVPPRREQLRAELDAAMLHLYGLDRSDAEHVLHSFDALRRNENRDHGEFRTKRLVLAAYDAMTEASRSGVPFVSPLDPPPGQGPRHKERM